jgi:hypothetical protein
MLNSAGKVEWWGHWAQWGRLGCAWFWLVALQWQVGLRCQSNSKKYALKHESHDRTVALPRRKRIPVALNASHHCTAVLHGLALGHAGGCVQPKITLPAKQQGKLRREVCNTKVEWLGAALTPPPPWQSGASARRNTHASQVVRSTSCMRVSGRSSKVTVTVSRKCWTFGGASRVQP